MHERLFRETEYPQGLFDKESYFQPLHLQMMERLRDRVPYCVRWATTPILVDWALRPLPTALFPFYYILRPIQLTRKYVLRLLERLL